MASRANFFVDVKAALQLCLVILTFKAAERPMLTLDFVLAGRCWLWR